MAKRHDAGIASKWVMFLTVLSVFLFFIKSQPLFAQVDEGAISGTVTDSTGAVVPSAKVSLKNTDVGLSLEATSDSGGGYSFSPVRTGHYTVTVTAPGFSTTTQEHLTVAVGQSLQVNVQLKTGSATETVEVTTAPPQLQTEDAAVGQVVNERSVNSLPLNGRNFTFLAQLGAGVNTPQADTRGNAASGAFTANGLQPSQNNYLLDGIDNNSNAVDFLNGTNYIVLPPVDAIQEFNVQTADFSAQLGRSAGAVLNATVKSGTNNLHGAVWEFFRNDVLDAADWFEDNAGIKKAELRQNQFGAAVGGPIIKNKLFFFGDYEGLRRVQGNTATGLAVPTDLERASGYTNLSDLIAGNAATRKDVLGRVMTAGTVMDPATTRAVNCGEVDPVTGRAGPGCAPGVPVGTPVGYVRDPFGLNTCSGAGLAAPSLAACPGLNQLPVNRIDANAVKLLNLYPAPTTGGVTSNFASNPNLYQHSNQFDARGDYDPNEKEQIFFRFSYVDNPQFIPGPFGGIADGGAFQQGIQTAKSDQAVLAWTHVFSPSMINVARGGFNHLHTTRFGPEGSTLGIPDQFGIQGIPQVSENGGLPQITPSGLSTLGSNNYLPSDEVSQTLQITDDFTKIYGKHSFKTGIEYQHVKFSTLQPAWSRGGFDFNGGFTDVVNQNSSTTGRAQMLLTPAALNANIPTDLGVPYSGGADQVQASNINKTYDEKNYFAGYFQDDWKVNSRLTLNLGLRYDYFGPISESNGAQSNFIPSGGPYGGPAYLIPASGKADRSLSTSFTDALAADGIALEVTNRFGKSLVQAQKNNIAPRAGFAYQVTPKLVARGGIGLFFNSFNNAGYGPNIGENYPFVFNFNYQQSSGGVSTVSPISAGTPWAGCPTAGPGGTATLNSGFSCLAFTPLQVNASGLSLQGLQFNFATPRTLSSNLTLQYAITPTLSAQVAYVFTDGMHIQSGVGTNNVTAILPAGADTTNLVPFPGFSHGSSYQSTIGASIYNGLQTKLEQQFSNGLNYLIAYTWSKTMSDAGDLLNGGSVNGYRAPDVPGFGPRFDWGLADFDLRNVLHLSGGYELPFGKEKRFAHDANAIENSVIGGWSLNWIAGLQPGSPISLSCPTATTAGTNCTDINVPGQSQKLGRHIDAQGKLNWFGNPAAFNQPCPLNAEGQSDPSLAAGCIPTSLRGVLGGYATTTRGPGLNTFTLSAIKAIPINERFSAQFRAEFFNILNHPTFNSPNFGGNGVVAVANSGNFTSPNFGEIGTTRNAPYDPRQIQFALKLYF